MRVSDNGIGISAEQMPQPVRDVRPGRFADRSLAGRPGHRPVARPRPGRDARRARSARTAPASARAASSSSACRWRGAPPPRPAGAAATAADAPVAPLPRAGGRRPARQRRQPGAADRAHGPRGRGRLRRRRGAARGGAVPARRRPARPRHAEAGRLRGLPAASATAPWGASVRLVAQSGWGQDEDRRRTAEAGFDHHIVKPIDPEALEVLMQTLAPAAARPPGARAGGVAGGGRRIARRRPTTPLGK